MNITLKAVESVKDLEVPLRFLNHVFSEFPPIVEHTAEIEFEKINNGKDPKVFEVYENDQLIAAAICYERHPGYYHITQLAVLRNQREKGVATQLYYSIEDKARELGYKGITVNTFNKFKSQLRLLIKRGYEIYDFNKDGEYENDPKIFLRLKF